MNQEPEPVSDASPETGPALDMSLYERLIDDGIADADKRGGAIDHVTARRLAIWLAARPQQRDFAGGLDQFIRTGAISQQLAVQARMRARSADHPHRAQAVRLLQYCASRRSQPGPVGPDFGTTCDQIDQADAMLADRRERIRQGGSKPGQATPEADSQVIARATRNSRTVSLTLDARTANIVMFAIAASAADREAHAREVDRFSHGLPEGTYGRQNREAIAAREMDAATRLRAAERAYQLAIDHDAAISYGPAAIRPADHVAEREIEME